ncbi:AMP-binding protein [Pseudomonas vancouverensis]|uniref:AMP-dependent synthetase/ligase domain-containing protein n=1 Tax=Pseudomonas vancouverensis TaxID=95300 RepID=A0A1H2MED4_PSEVA|nr:AMP-binding protein [Pseudomonas vancouverensis]KAB0499137.1 AMP-binding protein [Pseudomonas vancouverensis]TDB59882.1 hypothetical protein EIY72_18290 [Pseudomonas vancouverensis]SDU91385.1 fatty-acyl-CoA synthase [Pseudomonas vancouverensis]
MAVRNLADISAIEQTPLSHRHLPASTYATLHAAMQRMPDAPALSFFLEAQSCRDTHDWSYAQLFADITRTANALHDLGVRSQDVVAFVLPNLPETLTQYRSK